MIKQIEFIPMETHGSLEPIISDGMFIQTVSNYMEKNDF